MSENCFIRQEVNADMLKNTVSFCSECYKVISVDEVIFYDMKSYRYLCKSCKKKIEEHLDKQNEPISTHNNSLFSR